MDLKSTCRVDCLLSILFGKLFPSLWFYGHVSSQEPKKIVLEIASVAGVKGMIFFVEDAEIRKEETLPLLL